MNADLIAALERAAEAIEDNMMHWPRTSWPGSQCEHDADAIRQHIADLRAGNLVRREDAVAEERARVVAWLRNNTEQGAKSVTGVVPWRCCAIADAIEAGAHASVNVVHEGGE